MKPVSCDFVQNRRSAFVDESLPSSDAVAIQSHLRSCNSCLSGVEQTISLRQNIRRLPRKNVSPQLTIALKVIASKEVARRKRFQSFASLAENFRTDIQLWFNNLMRPLAIPMAGGFMAASLVFSMIISSYPLRGDSFTEDIPTRMYTEAAFKGMLPLELSDCKVVVDLTIDGQGRILDYEIAGGDIENDIRAYRSLNNMLLFSVFRPATSFGKPISGKIRLSFHRGHIEVQG